jgi:hypothetical protein
MSGVSPNGTITTLVGRSLAVNRFSGDGGPAANAPLNAPYGVAVQADGSASAVPARTAHHDILQATAIGLDFTS